MLYLNLHEASQRHATSDPRLLLHASLPSVLYQCAPPGGAASEGLTHAEQHNQKPRLPSPRDALAGAMLSPAAADRTGRGRHAGKGRCRSLRVVAAGLAAHCRRRDMWALQTASVPTSVRLTVNAKGACYLSRFVTVSTSALFGHLLLRIACGVQIVGQSTLHHDAHTGEPAAGIECQSTLPQAKSTLPRWRLPRRRQHAQLGHHWHIRSHPNGFKRLDCHNAVASHHLCSQARNNACKHVKNLAIQQ